MDYENGRLKVVGIGGTLREGSTPKVWKASDGEGRVTDENYGRRLDRLDLLVVELAEKVSPAHGIRRVETVRIAV